MQSRSLPFSVTILTLMALIVLPLVFALLLLGRHAVASLERRSVDQHMVALDEAVERSLTSGLQVIVAVGRTIAEQPSFTQRSEPSGDEERSRQLVGLLHRHPNMTAAYVGYDDGHFLYVGRTTFLSDTERRAMGVPSGNAIIIRKIDGVGPTRSEIWWFSIDSIVTGGYQSQANDFDPRVRPWYIGAKGSRGPFLTEPYRFAWSNSPGVSVAVPLPAGGVVGFDFALEVLSKVLDQHKITANSVIILSTGARDVLIESLPCSGEDCLPGDTEARAKLRQALAERETSGRRIEREVEAAGYGYRLIVHPMPVMLGQRFSVGAAVPIVELSADSRALIRRIAIAAVIAIGLAVLATLTVSLLLSRSLARITAKTERIRQLDFSDKARVTSRITEILQLSDAVERMREGLEVFGRYVSKDLVTEIMRAPAETGLGGTRRQLTVMFTDIEGFSRLSEGIDPELLTSRLSRYFEALGGAITANHGMIDKYIGDSIMAFWNAPQPHPDHIIDACRAALDVASASRGLAKKWRSRGRPAFRTRIGLHTGLAVVGNVGGRDRINYTLVGAVANQASRLESLNKTYGTEILASAEVAQPTMRHFVWRNIDRIVAAGTTEVLEIYEPLGRRQDDRDDVFLETWAQAQCAYRSCRFSEAVLFFERALRVRPDDRPCMVFIERCREFAAGKVPADWDGIWHFDRK